MLYRWVRNLKVHGMCIVEGAPTVPETIIPVSYLCITLQVIVTCVRSLVKGCLDIFMRLCMER